MKRLLLCIIFSFACSNSHTADIAIGNGSGDKPNPGQEWGKAHGYPEAWWNKPTDAIPAWEVGHTPDSAKPGEVVLSKRTELGVFSNFAATPFQYEGKTYASVEGFWQATKYPEGPDDERWKEKNWPYTRAQVEQMTGFEAKDAGTAANAIMKKLKINWVTFNEKKMVYYQEGDSPFYKLIRAAMIEKLAQNPSVLDLLLRTGSLKLLPDHAPGATDQKAWRYYEIWMELRKLAQDEVVAGDAENSPTNTTTKN